MRLRQLTLANVRNYAVLDFLPMPGLNVLYGANAQGKSNLLEAIGMLGTGKSFRTVREAELVRDGMPSAVISGEAHLRAGNMRLACTLATGPSGFRKRYTVNGEGVRYGAYLGRARVVTFTPADLALIAGPPSLRRSMLNAALSQESPRYYATLAAYANVLAQRNALLRGAIAPDGDLLATYDAELVATGTELMLARRTYVAAVAERARGVHATWVQPERGDDDLQIVYAPSVNADAATSAEIAAAFTVRLAALQSQEFARKTSLVGPHRDDVLFRLGLRPLAAFGSQGQQRTAVLALKVAEYVVLEARSGEAPILLLDDVLSELDAARQAAFLRGVGSFEQAFLTATKPLEGIVPAAAFRIESAHVYEA